MRYKNLSSLLLALILLCASTWSIAQNLWKVVMVTDGDTIWVKREGERRIKIRVWGIDTPEKYHSGKLVREAARCKVSIKEMRKLGILASKHAEKLFAEKGKMVRIEFRGTGYYRRYLGILYFTDGTDFGKQMISDGYACVYRKNQLESYRHAQSLAEKNRKGLWKINYRLMKCLCR
ncbi:MAG: hypothetical protein DRP29_09330 [Thermodesulfobacteriota bacterium]|nr:MAG: hypothetical protein DRP29_09330 [Thermodesulfobacteriota bacterium]